MSNFTINRGIANEFTLTIKQNNTTLPMEIEGTDTFTAKMFLLSTNEEISFVPAVDIYDTLNGQITLTFTEAQSNLLVSSRGEEVDRYYLKPMYKIILDCKTVNNGNFIAKIPEVYVD